VTQFRTPVERDYAAVLGYATFIFATFEWNVAWCGEKLERGFLSGIRGCTAATIGVRFQRVVESKTGLDKGSRDRLLTVASRFRTLAKERNRLMHAKPCTDPEGRASLSFTDGAKAAYWSPERIADVAHAFEEASGEANDLLHHALS
jgi:hypothetical protein